MKKAVCCLTLVSMLSMNILPAMADEFMSLPPVIKDNKKSDFGEYSNYTPEEPLRGSVFTIPVGTAFQVLTNENLESSQSQVGEIFTATLNQSISVEGNIIISAGSEITGQITYLQPAGRAGRNALMEIKFTGIKTDNGTKIPIMGKVLTKDDTGIIKGGAIKNQLVQQFATEAVATGGGTLLGMGIGAIAGEVGTGAAIGAVGGGVVGVGYLVMKKGREVKMPAGTKMIVILEQPFTVGQ